MTAHAHKARARDRQVEALEMAVSRGDRVEERRAALSLTRFDLDMAAREAAMEARAERTREMTARRHRKCRDPLWTLLKRGVICERQFRAAEALRDLDECAATGRSPSAALEYVDGRGQDVDHVGRSVDSARRARWAREQAFGWIEGHTLRAAVEGVVLQQVSLSRAQARIGVAKAVGLEKVRSAIAESLSRAADHVRLAA